MKTGLGKKEQAERTRARILDAAVGLFAKRGFASTTTQDIAKSVGMTPGVLYWHFASKEALLVAVLDMLFARVMRGVLREKEAIRPGALAETLESLIARVARIIESNVDYMLMIGVVSAEATDTNPMVEETLRTAYRRLAAVVEELLASGAAKGAGHSPSLDAACAAQMFMGLYMGGFMHHRLFRREFPLARALPVLQRMLLAAALPGAAITKAARRSPGSGSARRSGSPPGRAATTPKARARGSRRSASRDVSRS